MVPLRWRSTEDPWLSARLGVSAYRVAAVPADGEALEAVLRGLGAGGVFAYAKIAAEQVGATAALETAGFRLVDTNVTFARPIRRCAPSAADVTVRAARQDDVDAVCALAERSFRYSRFHLDPAIPRSVANTIKHDWTRSYFSGERGDAMVVALRDGRVVGFLQVLRPSEAELVIDLIAVDASERGRGTAVAMIGFAEHEAPGAERLVVGTQIANVPSVRLYEKDGLRLLRVEYVLHYHRGPR